MYQIPVWKKKSYFIDLADNSYKQSSMEFGTKNITSLFFAFMCGNSIFTFMPLVLAIVFWYHVFCREFSSNDASDTGRCLYST